ncbi:chemokine-like receptor 1 [Arapaima gigas]
MSSTFQQVMNYDSVHDCGGGRSFTRAKVTAGSVNTQHRLTSETIGDGGAARIKDRRLDRKNKSFPVGEQRGHAGKGDAMKEQTNVTLGSPTGGEVNLCAGSVHTVALVIYFVAFLLGPFGNGLVIYVTGFKMKRTVNVIWFLNLAIADFLFTAFLLFSIVYMIRGCRWPFGDIMCKLNSLVGVLNMFASIFLLVAISIDRCLMMWMVVWAQNKRTTRKATVVCVLIWVAALGCSIPYGVVRRALRYANVTVCGAPHISDTMHRDLVIFRSVAGFIIPFLIILGAYIAIGLRILSLNRKKTFKPFRIILGVILAFFLCWLPFHIFQYLEVICMTSRPTLCHVAKIGGPLSTSVAFLNSCLNPILYVFMCEDFRRKFRHSILSVLESAFTEELLVCNANKPTCAKPLDSDRTKETEGFLMTSSHNS